jgi:hypothetical protein
MTGSGTDEPGLIAHLRERFAELGDTPPDPPAAVPVERHVETDPEPEPRADALAVVDDLLQVAVVATRASAAPSGPSAELRILHHGTVHLDAGQTLILGRAHGEGRRAIAIPQLSRGHVRLEMSHDGLTATDLGSTNGTAHRSHGREHALEANVPVRLAVGDSLVVAREHEICRVIAVAA